MKKIACSLKTIVAVYVQHDSSSTRSAYTILRESDDRGVVTAGK